MRKLSAAVLALLFACLFGQAEAVQIEHVIMHAWAQYPGSDVYVGTGAWQGTYVTGKIGGVTYEYNEGGYGIVVSRDGTKDWRQLDRFNSWYVSCIHLALPGQIGCNIELNAKRNDQDKDGFEVVSFGANNICVGVSAADTAPAQIRIGKSKPVEISGRPLCLRGDQAKPLIAQMKKPGEIQVLFKDDVTGEPVDVTIKHSGFSAALEMLRWLQIQVGTGVLQ